MSEARGYGKPLPDFRPETRRYWEGCKGHELLIPRSKVSGEYFFYPRAYSPGEEMSKEIEWVRSRGLGKVWTYAVHHMGPTKAYKGEPPYVVALVELGEGVKIMTNVVGVEAGDVYIGMEVEVVFDDVTDEVTLPKFKPVKKEGGK